MSKMPEFMQNRGVRLALVGALGLGAIAGCAAEDTPPVSAFEDVAVPEYREFAPETTASAEESAATRAPAAPGTSEPAAPAAEQPQPVAPAAAQLVYNGPPPPFPEVIPQPNDALDHSYDFDLTGDLVPLTQAQLDIINSLNMPQDDKDQVALLMSGAMTLQAAGIPINLPGSTGQGILESGRISDVAPNTLALQYQNRYGMKARPSVPADQKVNLNSAEYENGQMTAPKPSDFLEWEGEPITEGFEGYGEFILQRWWYRDALRYPENHQYHSYLMNFVDDGNMQWTPTPEYVGTVEQIIHENRLVDIANAAMIR